MLTLRALGTSGSLGIGRVIRSEPFRYEVIGLPTGSGAMLARLSGVWKILRIERGKYHAWNGSFVSAEDALASIDGHKAQAVGLEVLPSLSGNTTASWSPAK